MAVPDMPELALKVVICIPECAFHREISPWNDPVAIFTPSGENATHEILWGSRDIIW